jgi:hypothetical protein
MHLHDTISDALYVEQGEPAAFALTLIEASGAVAGGS